MRQTFFNDNILSYEELMSLSDEQCIGVNRTYFHYLMAKGTLLEIKDKDYYVIFRKYLEVDKMVDLIKGFNTTTRYFLMSVSDIKYLLTLIKDIPTSKTAFVKSEVNAQELNDRHNNIKKRFLDNKEEKFEKAFFAPVVLGEYKEESELTEAEKQRRRNKLKQDNNYNINSDTCIPVSLCRMPKPAGKIYRGETQNIDKENIGGPVLSKKFTRK